MQCTHRGFLESASRQNCCDHLNALFLQQLLADSSSACICIHACRSMQSGVRRQLLKRHCVQVVPKNTAHRRRSALSRKPLWMYLSPPSKSGSSSNDGWSTKFLSRLSKNGRKKLCNRFSWINTDPFLYLIVRTLLVLLQWKKWKRVFCEEK